MVVVQLLLPLISFSVAVGQWTFCKQSFIHVATFYGQIWVAVRHKFDRPFSLMGVFGGEFSSEKAGKSIKTAPVTVHAAGRPLHHYHTSTPQQVIIDTSEADLLLVGIAL